MRVNGFGAVQIFGAYLANTGMSVPRRGRYVGCIYEALQKVNKCLMVLNVANRAKDILDNKQEGVLAPNLRFRESSV